MNAGSQIGLICVNAVPLSGRNMNTILTRFFPILRDRHRSTAVIVHGMHYLLNEIQQRGAKVDHKVKVFRAMMYYLDDIWNDIPNWVKVIMSTVARYRRMAGLDWGRRKTDSGGLLHVRDCI